MTKDDETNFVIRNKGNLNHYFNFTYEIEIRTVKPQSYFNYTCKIEIREPASSVSPKTAIIDHK